MSENKSKSSLDGCLALLVLIGIFYLVTRQAADRMPLPPPAGSTEQMRDQMVTHFQSDAEPTARDATWTKDDVFKDGVIDDGTNRDGYADYFLRDSESEGL